MDDQLQELARDVRERALTYSFLARVLSDDEVGTDFLAQLAQDVPETGTELDAYAKGLSGRDLEEARTELAADHASTLLGMSARPVSPFESGYTSEKHLMMQDSRDQVVDAYAREGFAKAKEYHVPEDHISLELDFMAGLGNRAANAIDKVLSGEVSEPQAGSDPLAEAEHAMNVQLDFLEKHLLVWTPTFCDELEKRSSTQFYRGVAQMLRTFLEQEREYLAHLNGIAAEEAQDAAE